MKKRLKKIKKKLKKIGEILLAIIVAVPICIGMIICAFGILFVVGTVAVIIVATIVPIAIVINAVTDLTNHKKQQSCNSKKEDIGHEEDALGPKGFVKKIIVYSDKLRRII